MRLMRRLTFLPALLLIVVCAYGQDVHYNYDRSGNFYDRNGNFASYKTYQWVEFRGGTVPDPLIDQAIKRSVDEQLAQKGPTRVEKCADLYVGYQATINDGKSATCWRTGEPRRLDGDAGQGSTSRIPIRNLAVNLYDPSRKQLIWRGDTSRAIGLKKDPGKTYKNLQKTMAKLFKNYPPQPSK
jgi:uncharacterized protein DUF4136